jgi:CheY-like chemotaxis protein
LLSQLEEQKIINRRKLDLLSNVSHEIRTPLNAILGFSQLLSNSELTDITKKQYIDIINSKGSALTRLINDIIDFNKIEKGELTIVRSSVNINRLLSDIYNFYLTDLALFKREGIELKLSIPDGTDFLDLLTDEGRIVQVLENLIDNALKFTERGVVEFGYTIVNDSINLFVRDTGVGIDPKIQEFIFEKYRQLDSSMSSGGAGLGLKISKEIVSLLGGRISIDSEVGVGTTVYAQLPIARCIDEGSSVDEEFNNSERKVDFKNKVILVVDDEEVNYLILNELLTVWGATTIWAKNGKEAVELVNSMNQNIDAILMDIRMPVMDGYAATMEIKQINSRIPIIAQTAYASDEDRLKAEAAGCNGYITKPIETNILSEVLEIFLSS